MVTESEFMAASDKPLEVYNEFRAQMAELEAHNLALVFDYKDPKGNKEARSHVFKLRKTKGAIEAARKDAKAAALAYGRRVDEEAKQLVEKIEGMIDHHQKPLDEIEAKEQARLDFIKGIISAIEAMGEGLVSLPSTVLAQRIAELEKVSVDDSFAEFLGDAAKAHDLSLLRLRAQLPETQKREAEAKELEELRALKAQKEAEDKAKAEAAAAEQRRIDEENARQAAAAKEAKEKAAREEIARLQAEERAKEAEEREKQAKADNARRLQEMADKAKKDAEEAAAAAKAQAEAEQKARDEAAAAEQAKREANKKHVAKIQHEIKQSIFDAQSDWPEPLSMAQCDSLCETISQGKIRHLSINY